MLCYYLMRYVITYTYYYILTNVLNLWLVFVWFAVFNFVNQISCLVCECWQFLNHLCLFDFPDFLCIWNTNFQTLQAGKEMAGKLYGQVRTCVQVNIQYHIVFESTFHTTKFNTMCCTLKHYQIKWLKDGGKWKRLYHCANVLFILQ